MKVKLREILQSFDALQELLKTKFPAATAFKLAQLARAAQQALDDFAKARENITQRQPDTTLTEEETKELSNLLEEEVELPFVKLALEQLNKVEIEPVHLMTLDWLIDNSSLDK